MTMKIATRDFGEIEAEERDILTFCQPIFGFEELKRYILLMDDSLNGEFVWLQSVENEQVCFILVNPTAVLPDYAPTLSKDAQKALGDGAYEAWCIMVAADEFAQSTVNLKSPVVLNLNNNTGMQVILEEDYPIRQKLISCGEGAAAC